MSMGRTGMTELRVAKSILRKIKKDIRPLNNYALIPYGATRCRGIEIFTGLVCLASLLYKKNEEDIKYFVDNPSLKIKDQYQKDYINWLINDSPFASAFVIKDEEFIYRYGAVYSTKFPPQFVVSAAISLRYVTEFPHIIRCWNRFKDYIPPEAAFVLAHLLYEGEKNNWLVGHYGNTNHQWVQTHSFGKNELKRFVEFDFSRMKGWPLMKNTQQYAKLTGVWSNTSQYYSLTTPLGKTKTEKSSWGDYCSFHSIDDVDIKKACRDWLEMNYGG